MHLTDPRHARLVTLRALALAMCASAMVAACGPAGLDSAGDTINSGNGSGNGSISGSSSGGSVTSYTVGGTVIGVSGSGLVLANNAGDALPISGNGGFTFSNSLAGGATYAVTIQSQPIDPSQICTVMNGAGKVSTVNVNSVIVSCTTNYYTVGGAVSGLSGSGLVLQTNGGNNVAVTSSGSYTLATLASGSNYTVTVMTQPTSPSQTCTVANDTGMLTSANVSNVAITCTTNNYTVGGSVTGLSGTGLVVQTNGANGFPVSASGSYTFATLPSGAAYNVTVLSQPINPAQTCVVANGSGTIISANITLVAISCTSNGHTVGGTVGGLAGSGLVLQDNGGDNLAVSASGAFTFATPLVSGAAYAVTVQTQPSSPPQYCSVTNGTGTMTAANVTSVTITCRTDGRYAFVSDYYANSVTAFSIETISGNLALVNSAPSDANPTAIAVTPNGAFVYTANAGAADISIYAVNAATGALTGVGTQSTGAGSTPSGITVDPSGQFVLATDSAGGTGLGTVLVFLIDPTNGALTQVAGSPFATAPFPGTSPSSVAVDPSDRYVFATNQYHPPLGLAGYTLNATPGSGDLTQFSTWQVPTGNNPVWVTVDPLDRFVYVSNNTDATLSGWTIGAGGALTAVTGSPFAGGFAGGANPEIIAIDPTGQFLYVTDSLNDQIVAFTIDQTTGALTPMASLLTVVGDGAFALAIDPSGQFVYEGNSYVGTISMFTRNPNTGALTAVPGSPRTYGGNWPSAIAIE